MTTDMQEYIPASTPTAIAPFGSVAAFETAQRIAKALMDADITPQQFRGNMGNCLIAMEMAARTGSSILAVMQSIYVVHGTPGWSGQYCIAALNQSLKFAEPVHYEFQGTEGKDDWGCRAVTTSRSGKRIQGPLVTIGTAKAEGWYNRQGSKWKTIPELMLRYRAASWLAKTEAPEILMGMQTSDELMDMGEAAAQPAPIKVVNTADLEVSGGTSVQTAQQEEGQEEQASPPAQGTTESPTDEPIYPKKVGPGKFDWVDSDGIKFAEAKDVNGDFLFGWRAEDDRPSHKDDGRFRAGRGKGVRAEAYRLKFIKEKQEEAQREPRRVPAEDRPVQETVTGGEPQDSVATDADTDAWREEYAAGEASGIKPASESHSEAHPPEEKSRTDEWNLE